MTQPPTPASKIETMPDVRDLLNQVSVHLQESTAEFRSLKAEVHAVIERVESVEQRIDGSKPPPPGAPPLVRIIGDVAATATKADADATKARASASQHDLDVPALRAELAEVKRELRAQSNWMGLGKKGVRWLFSARGLKTCAQIATLAGALYAAFQASAHAHPAASSPVVLPAPPGSR